MKLFGGKTAVGGAIPTVTLSGYVTVRGVKLVGYKKWGTNSREGECGNGEGIPPQLTVEYGERREFP